MYAGRRRGDGLEALLLEVETSTLPAGLEIPRASGLDIQATPTVPGPTGRTCFHVAVSDQRYRDVFATLAPDVLDSVLAAETDADAVERFMSRIQRWQSFLRDFDPEGLSEEAQRGLFGELWLLEQLLDEGLSGALVVSRWRGPKKDAHDFQLPAAAVEVKTTKAATPRGIRISNVKQLDDRGLPMLLLFLLQVEESASAELSLPELVDRLRTRLNEACRRELDDSLFRAGYSDQQFVDAAPCRYTMRRERWFHVAGDFPRLLEPDLPDGVVEVRFTVDLTACLPCQRDREDILPILKATTASSD